MTKIKMRYLTYKCCNGGGECFPDEFDYPRNIYAEGFQDGLREGESEYDDAIIITEDEARDRLTEEGFLRLIGGEN